MHPVAFFDIENCAQAPSSEELRERVANARRIQQRRYMDVEDVNVNAQMGTPLMKKYCVLDEESLQLLKTSCEKYAYSARVVHKLLRLGRTSADLDGVENIRKKDIERVLECRDLDRGNSKMMVVN